MFQYCLRLIKLFICHRNFKTPLRMKKILLLAFSAATFALGAQIRYLDEVFTPGQIDITHDVTYGTNINYFISDFTNLSCVGQDLGQLWPLVLTSQPIPAKYYNPADTTTCLKVSDLKFDVYKPSSLADTATNRPVFVYLHTGSFLPVCINGGVTGERIDSSAVNICKRMAMRGYVAFSVSYRGGWNPLAASALQRRAQLLNAVYRALLDTKQAIRVIKADASTYGIDPTKVVLYGQGTGGYIALGYATLDRGSELLTDGKFELSPGVSVIDTNTAGYMNGIGPVGSLNLYIGNGQNSEISALVHTGGAMPDTSWINGGEVPMIAFHCLRDPYAPFMNGDVLTPPNADFVVEVQGAGEYMKKVNAKGNNACFYNRAWNDPYTLSARAKYGKTYGYIFPAPDDEITLYGQADIDGVYPVVLPLGASFFLNQNSPWEFWDQATAIGRCGAQTNGQSLAANPGMGKAKSTTYVDTIMGYMAPRLACALSLPGTEVFGVEEALASGSLTIFPNPANEMFTVRVTAQNVQLETIEVIDITGKRLAEVSAKGETEKQVDVASYAAGIYLVRVHTTKGVTVQKITVK
jgi:dienelactone hydrolase